MHFQNVSIVGLGYVDAPHRVTSTEIEAQFADTMDRFRVPQGLLEGLSGIVARRFWDVGTQPSEAATQAGEIALENSGIAREKIGVLINTSVCRDYIEPSTASLVHGNLGLGSHALNFDVGNACLGFINGMQIAANMIELGQTDYALIVNAEGSRYAVEQTIKRMQDPECDMKTFRGQYATLTLGSGAVGMVIGRSDLLPDGEGHPIRHSLALAATEYNRLCLGQPDQMVTDSKGLLNAGIGLSVKMRELMLENWQKEPDSMDEIVIHQVSQPHTDQVIEATCMSPDKVNRIYPEFGNIGPAGVPIVLAKSLEQGRIKSGDHVGLFGIGSGVNCMVMEVEW